MDVAQMKEQFSNAYVRAVAAAAGYTCYKPEVDSDSVDWGIAAAGGGGTRRSPRLELQLKCTSREVMDEHELRYPLKVKNYEELRAGNFLVPRILVVLVVPEKVPDWLTQSEEELVMRHCAYWTSLRGLNSRGNLASVTVSVPRAQLFTPGALQEMMRRIAEGGQP